MKNWLRCFTIVVIGLALNSCVNLNRTTIFVQNNSGSSFCFSVSEMEDSRTNRENKFLVKSNSEVETTDRRLFYASKIEFWDCENTKTLSSTIFDTDFTRKLSVNISEEKSFQYEFILTDEGEKLMKEFE